MCHIRIGWLCWAVLSCLLVQTPVARAQSIEEAFSGSLTEMPSGKLSVSGAFYVPVYSSVAMSNGKLRTDFAVTLKPFGTIKVFVPTTDVRGGTWG